MRVFACLVLAACASKAAPTPQPTEPICAALARVVPEARQRFSNLVVSSPVETQEDVDRLFANRGPSTIGLPGGSAEVSFDGVVGVWSVTFHDASAYPDVRDAVARCGVLAGWTREPAHDNEAIWFRDVQYEMGPPRQLRLRVNRMLASDPLALEPKTDSLWLTLSVSPQITGR